MKPVTAVAINEFMQVAPRSIAEIAWAHRIHPQTARKYVQELVDNKLAYIATWGEDARGYRIIRQYQWGKKKDVPRPPVASPAERMAITRVRRRASGVVGKESQ